MAVPPVHTRSGGHSHIQGSYETRLPGDDWRGGPGITISLGLKLRQDPVLLAGAGIVALLPLLLD